MLLVLGSFAFLLGNGKDPCALKFIVAGTRVHRRGASFWEFHERDIRRLLFSCCFDFSRESNVEER